MSMQVDTAKSEGFRIQGNNSFKKGRWTEAIGHYTSAILHNPRDPIAYTNRSFAYLKLEKFRDAERDCSSALDIQGDNVKALYRRGLARKGLGRYKDALKDVEEVLKIDGDNESALEEVEELKGLIRKDEAALQKSRSKPALPPSPPQSAHIEELPPDVPPEVPTIARQSKEGLETVLSKDTRQQQPAESDSITTATSSFSSLRKSRDIKKTYISPSTPNPPPTPKSSSASSDQATLLPITSKSPPPPSPSMLPTPITSTPARSNSTKNESDIRLPPPPSKSTSTSPGSGLTLLRNLTTLPTRFAWKYIKYYPPEIIPTILSPLLEPDTLAILLTVLLEGVNQNEGEEKSRVRTIMSGLRGKGRWGMNVVMLSKGERGVGDEVWEACGGEGDWKR